MSQLGSLFIISAASGSGKSSLVRSVIKEIDNISLSVSYTSRSPRATEKEGIDYFFVSEEQFLLMQKDDCFLENVNLYDNYYATSKSFVHQKLIQGQDVLLEIDWQGAKKIKQLLAHWYLNTNPLIKDYLPCCVSIFILPPSLQSLAERLLNRGQDSTDVINKRLKLAQEEIKHYSDYDYLIVNNDFNQAKQDLTTIIKAHRLTVFKQKMVYAPLIKNLLG
jgi:guanylate kinase